MVRQNLGEESRVARNRIWDGGESVVVWRKDGLVSVTELAEEGLSFGGVVDGRSDTSEGGESGSTEVSECESGFVRVCLATMGQRVLGVFRRHDRSGQDRRITETEQRG